MTLTVLSYYRQAYDSLDVYIYIFSHRKFHMAK